MRNVTINDIKQRMKSLKRMNENSNINSIESFSKGAYNAINKKNVNDIKRILESAVNNSQEYSSRLYVDLFEAVTENGNMQDIRYAGNLLEDAPVKVRDSKALNTLLKRRLGRVKSKSALKNVDNPQEVMTASLPKPPTPTATVSATENAIANIYENTMNNMEMYEHCDRVLENYNSISKRFNIDSLFYENTRINGVGDTVVSLCRMIDTYNMPDYIKFNTVIESALYGFESNSINYNKSEILENAVDYFLFKKDGLESCKKILENTVFFDKDKDMGNIDIITEEEPETEDDALSVEKSIKEYCVPKRKLNKINYIKENTEFSDLFKKFKEEEIAGSEKPEGKLRQLVTKLYSKNVDDIVNGTPSLLNWIRSFFIIGSCAIPAIGPILMIITFIADKFISLHFQRKETEKMIKCFENEIKKSKDKMNQDTTSNEDKENLKKYIDSLKKAKTKIEDYYNELLTDEEQEERYNNMEFDMDDFDLSDIEGADDISDEDISDFFESAFDSISESIDNLSICLNNHRITNADIFAIPSLDSDSDIIYIAKLVSKFPEELYKDSLEDGIKAELMTIAGFSNKYNKKENLKTALEILNREQPEPPIDVQQACNYLNNLTEAYESIAMIIEATDKSNPENILESSITNKLKMASMKLRNLMTKMSDKEKQISRSVDVGTNNFKKGVERALTNDNRESIIKGSVLPSASKVIKMAIINAGLIAIGQPALAVIGTLGYLGVSKGFKAKERQALTDEIEIELKMCQKYIDIAEQKNDMKALKQLLMIQRDLERQHQRIKYKMRADLGQKYYDAKHVGD